MAKKAALVLAGCGVFDGAEIHEAVLTNLALHREGFEVEYLAPNIEQAHVFDHLKGENAAGETRNVLTEAARIARGHIKALEEAKPDEYDALVFPGGFGAAKNLCTYAFDGPECTVNEAVKAFVESFFRAQKPIVFMCIAPMLAARVLDGVELTPGSNPKYCQEIDQLGCKHVVCKSSEWHVDETHKVITTPAYNNEEPITEIEKGISGAIRALAALV